ncbi:MAG: YciI family protein [Hyphomicrobiaceae bacterium]
MADFILLMHNDYRPDDDAGNWQPYLDTLSCAGVLRGGSALGAGLCLRRSGEVPELTSQLVGYVKIEARDMDHAQELVQGNPVYEAGGTVEIRELPVAQ